MKTASACLLAALLGASCGGRLDHGAPSLEALAASVLEAFARQDVERLERLALSEREFRSVVWPELPAARPERNLTPEFVWADLRAKSRGYLRAAQARHGGRQVDLVRVEFAGGTTQHQSYLIHRKAVLTVRDSGGESEEIRLFGSVLERGGRFKVFSYVTD